MSSTRYTSFVILLFIGFCHFTLPVFGQKGVTLDIKKPKEFENRVLGSEKSDQKKFTIPKRFIQNTVTHYNYFFNANNKLNEVLQRAKSGFQDDFSKLIPFYNYTLDMTAADSIQLDSISYKAQTGIVLHDLRNDWADNLYLLWGASYFYRKQFDSAQLMFQFINYAFAEKEKDGYYKTIGSALDGNSALSVSTKEKNSLPRRMFAEPPSRNDAFIWQIRNHLAQDQFTEASSLVQTLKNDPLFPERLQSELEEVQAYAFYKQKMWDSSAVHLQKALNNAPTKNERARWEYLLGQLYETTGKMSDAENWYSKSVGHTTDPIMDVYGRLAMVRVNKETGEDHIDKNIATLVRMAKRDKYLDYRDIIYFMAAQMELERDNIDGALPLLLKSTKYASNDPAQRNKAFLQLAELSFLKKQYRNSYNFYDSLQLNDPAIKDPEAIEARKTILGKLAASIEIIERQDSLQKIAAMPEDERKSYVRKLVRQLRKLQGLKDEGVATGGSSSSGNEQPASLFSDNNKKGEWYFYNKTSRQKGKTDFEARWGKRANADNWRRSAALNAASVRAGEADAIRRANRINSDEVPEINFELLYEKLPLTEETMQRSNDSIQNAMLVMGMTYIRDLEDCVAGTETFEELRNRFPAHPKMEEALFQLYYCYNKLGETAKANNVKQAMSQQYPDSKLTSIITTGKDSQVQERQTAATKTYEQVYDLFIEGNFQQALAQKKAADSIYGNNHWTPQLLYIEAVYHVKQRNDSTAIATLQNIINQFESSPLADKATALINVLSRRNQIEEELREMVINMPAPDTMTQRSEIITTGKAVTTIEPSKTDSIKSTAAPVVITQPRLDTVTRQPVKQAPVEDAYYFDAGTPHYVALVLTRVDPIFMNEAKNAFARYNRDTYYNKKMQTELVEIDSVNRVLLISPFGNAAEAIAYIDQTLPRTAREIIPWLKGGKYSYSIITARNLEMLREKKDLDKYREFLNKNIPGKF